MNVDFFNNLERFGTTKASIRRVFTASQDSLTGATEKVYLTKIAQKEFDKGKKISKADKKEIKGAVIKHFWDARRKFEERIASRIQEGRRWNLNNYKFYMMSDLAWDSVPIVPENIPLQLYAQGRINFSDCRKQLTKCVNDKTMTPEDFNRIFIKDPDNPKDIKAINLPRLHEVSVNLVRSMIRRRVAAQSNKYNRLYPYYVYEPRSKTMVQKLRSDVLSQRVEAITDAYGYRAHFTQVLRKNFLYSHGVSFIEQAWDKVKQYREKREPGTARGGEGDMELYIVREGVKFFSPHPTRIFYDHQFPLSSINQSNGIKYCGYWDIIRFRDILDNPKFYNKKAVNLSDTRDFLHNTDYFNYYFGSTKISFPSGGGSVEEANKRDTNMARNLFNSSQGDSHAWLANYYEQVIPKDVGFGDYPNPVWVRCQVASDRTVVFAEFLPTTSPGAYMGHDEDDSKIINQGMAHEIVPYQDQVSNLFSQALYLMKIQSILIMAVDNDVLDPDQIKHIRDIADSGAYYSKMLIVEHSASDDKELFDERTGDRPPISITQSQAGIGQVINGLLGNVSSIMAMLDRNQMMSPQEAGTFAKKERTTAQEVHEVSQTTNTLFSFTSEGPDQYRASMKRILQESLVALGSKEVKVFTQERYPDEVIKLAGFEVDREFEVEGYSLDEQKRSLTGTLKDIAFEYIHNSRDGSERTVSTEMAKVIGELTRYVFATPEMFQVFVQNFGIDQVTNMISEVFRLSGAGFVLKVPAAAESQQQQLTTLIEQLQTAIEDGGTVATDQQGQIEQIKQLILQIAAASGIQLNELEAGGAVTPAAPVAAAPTVPTGGPPKPAVPATVLQAQAP